jgi:outer membrane protein assembly factor BamA
MRPIARSRLRATYPPRMCQLLGQASENPHDSQVRDSVQAQIIKEYHRRGFFEAAVNWKDMEKLNTSATTVVLTITESSVYRLRRLEMIGNATTRDNVIRRRVALNEGERF